MLLAVAYRLQSGSAHALEDNTERKITAAESRQRGARQVKQAPC